MYRVAPELFDTNLEEMRMNFNFKLVDKFFVKFNTGLPKINEFIYFEFDFQIPIIRKL